MRYIIITAIFVFIFTANLFADTIVMKSGEKAKGLVVDEYVDRITFSTVEGEKDILRENIDRIEYDTPEQNFMQLAREYDRKGWYDKAAFYYKKAMDLNPSYKDAREGYLASHAKMWRQEERRTKKELERQGMLMDWRRNRNKDTSSPPKDKELVLKDTIGLSIVEEQGFFAIGEVMAHSSADRAGIKQGDLLVGIWGKLVKYWSAEEILDELLGPKYSEVRVLIEKEIRVPVDMSSKDLYKDLGISLAFEYEGLVIKDVAGGQKGDSFGLKEGDFVIAVDKNMTRYLPLDSVIALINSPENNGEIVFTVRRNINLRRE